MDFIKVTNRSDGEVTGIFDGQTYVFAPHEEKMLMAKKSETGSDVRIVIAPFGWVFVGKYSLEYRQHLVVRTPESMPTEKLNDVAKAALANVGYSPTVVLKDASVIRRWGTTKGLGQLINGPLKETVLDPCGTVEIHEQTVVAAIKCEGGWNL